ncbi:MAG: addiction module protein [Phycisphaerales bacterium]|jgi:hypothetical protein|nr:addiction module protein [Phycisphaerales bacterium]
MQLVIPLEKMTTADKLKALEEIWSDLQRTPDEVPSPAWHADVLHAREARVKEGSSQFQDWPTAKRRIREQTQ